RRRRDRAAPRDGHADGADAPDRLRQGRGRGLARQAACRSSRDQGPGGNRPGRAPAARAPGRRSALDPGAGPGRVPGRERADDRCRTPQRGAPEKRGFSWRKPRHTLQERQDVAAVAGGRAGLAELKRRAVAGAIRLLFGDESEVSTHPYLAHTWAPKGFDLKVQAPGQAKRRALLGVRDARTGELIVEIARTKRSADF